MLRSLVCVLVFLSTLAAEFQAPLDALPTLEHQRILEYAGHVLEDACDAEEISFMQKHAHRHPAHNIRSPSEKIIWKANFMLNHNDEGTAGVLEERLMVVLCLLVGCIVLGGLACYMFDPREEDGDVGNTEDYEVEVRRHEDLPSDTLGFMILAIVRDTSDIMLGRQHVFTSYSRIVVAASLLALNTGIQLYLFSCILVYVVPAAVSGIRGTYEQYEEVMYDKHTTLSTNGEIRGLPSYFDPARFSKLDEDVKQAVCAIPLGQPHFFYPLLFIWTLRCMAELKNATDLTYLMIVRMPTVKSMAEAMTVRQVPALTTHDVKMQLNVKTIVGMTRTIKGLTFILVLLPRMCITCFLCWLGSRWLAAASDFGNLVLDTVAVEFMLLLKQLLYVTLVSDRNKRDMNLTQLRPETKSERNTLWVYVCTSMWVFMAIGWVTFYCGYFQMVIIDYNWDVSEVCTAWISSVYPSRIL